MKNLSEVLARVAATLWVGGIWSIGYIAAPVLFSSLANKQLAGNLAGNMFTIMAYVGMVCGLYLIFQRLTVYGGGAFKQMFVWIALTMLLMTLAAYFGIQPILESLKQQAMPQAVMESIFRDRFARWHGISSIIYLLQSLLGLVLILKQDRR